MTVNHLPAELTFWDGVAKVWRIYALNGSQQTTPIGCAIVERPVIGVLDEDEAVGLSD